MAFFTGVLSGIVATVPMTVMMLTAFFFLPRSERYPLPPKEIVDVIVTRADPSARLHETELKWLTVAAHFGFGGAVGGIFGLIAQFLWQPLWSAAIVFGILVWSSSYMFGLPALGILKTAIKHPVRRNFLMVAAHVVWGFSLGLLFDWLAVISGMA